MPKSKGPIYTSKENRLKDGCEKHGRLPKYYSSHLFELNCWFPCRDGKMDAVAQEDGSIHILVFDHNFDDNIGGYEVEFKITRTEKPMVIDDYVGYQVKIKNANSEKYWEVENSQVNNGANIRQWEFDENPFNKLWIIQKI